MQLNKIAAVFKFVSSTALFLVVPGFAVYSLASAQSWFGPVKPAAHLEAADDPVLNGLQIIERHQVGSAPTAQPEAKTPALILLDDWTYTKLTTSSYQ